MTERDIPENWSSGKKLRSDQQFKLSRQQQPIDQGGIKSRSMTSKSKSVKQQNKPISEDLTIDQSSSSEHVADAGSWKLPGWTKSWVLWTGLLAFVPGTVAFLAMAMLLKLPSAPNCPSVFWPLASAAVRLHCAELAASKQNVDSLLQAIALVKDLPENHPLRSQIDGYVEEWSKRVLEIADGTFQAGKLEEAIAIAKRIPSDVSAYKLVEDKIANWQSIWAKGEEIFKEAEDHMREQRWHQAFMTAARLQRINNSFWETTKYEELTKLITLAREDGEKLAQARGLARNGSVDSLLKAIKLAESITSSSYVYPKAQEAIPEFGRRMLDLAQRRLDSRDADEAISIAQQIPLTAKLQAETEDFIAIAEAQRNAWLGTISGLEAAIAQAQRIDPSRPVYQKAQELASRWQIEIGDVTRLDRARMLASQGTISDLGAAIAEAQLIPSSNPRGREARQEINRWSAQIQTIEDRPFLDRAEQLALAEDINSLQQAIAEASQIRRGRALYPEARKKISAWTATIQRIQDQPILERARSLAANGNLGAAIETIRSISQGRSLSGEARNDIETWQEELTAQQNWKNARDTALRGTPEALAEAIRIAQRIPRRNFLRNEANPAIDQWSQQILDIARGQSQSSITRAIETARLIPRGTSAHGLARQQIREWENFLNPPQPQPTEEPIVPPRPF